MGWSQFDRPRPHLVKPTSDNDHPREHLPGPLLCRTATIAVLRFDRQLRKPPIDRIPLEGVDIAWPDRASYSRRDRPIFARAESTAATGTAWFYTHAYNRFIRTGLADITDPASTAPLHRALNDLATRSGLAA